MLQRIRQLRLVILMSIGIFCLENINYIPPPKEEVVVESQEEKPNYLQLMTERKLWLAQESAAYALHKATGIPGDRARTIVEVVQKEANRYEDMDYTRVLGLIVVESRANTQAVSPVGARGLMQIMPETGQFIAANFQEDWKGPRSLHDLERNVRYGTWYLYYLREFFPERVQARLAAYNWGPQAVLDREAAGKGVPRIYPQQVLEAQQTIEKGMYVYYQEHYWRSLDLDRDPPYFDDDTCQPEDCSRFAQVSGDDGEGEFLRER